MLEKNKLPGGVIGDLEYINVDCGGNKKYHLIFMQVEVIFNKYHRCCKENGTVYVKTHT